MEVAAQPELEVLLPTKEVPVRPPEQEGVEPVQEAAAAVAQEHPVSAVAAAEAVAAAVAAAPASAPASPKRTLPTRA